MTSTNQPLTLPQAIQLGLEHFQAGRLPQAETIFRQILTVEPENATALQLLGCIAHEAGQYDQAVTFFNQAVKRNPADPFLLFNMGVSLEEQGKLDEALACFRKVVTLKPDHLKAHIKLAVKLQKLGRVDESVTAYRKALQLNPGNAVAHNNLGVALQNLGKLDEAISSYRRALELKSDYGEAHNNLGSALRDLNKPDEALIHLRRALQLNPNYAEAHNNLGSTLRDLGKACEAMACYREALKLKPDFAEAYSNLGNTLRAEGHLEEAITCHHKALSLEPGNAIAHTNLGATLQDQGKYDEALACFRKAMQLKPDSAATQWNLSMVLLLRGDIAEGLTLYEKRFEGGSKAELAKAKERDAKLSGKPRWKGEDLRGKRLLLWTEQGLGDSMMMMRYLPLLKARGAGEILVCCRPELVKVIQTLPVACTIIIEGTPFSLDSFDCHCPFMSLPHLFGTRLETIPNKVPYITVPPDMSEKWVQRLAVTKGLKVGLAWAGRKTMKRDFLRSIPFSQLVPLLAVPGIQFVSLQKGEDIVNPQVFDWMADCQDFLDTAALIQQLDLVISVDTAVAHLAGALGKPVWLLNRFESEWRWLLNREDSPWYPTMRIFRQPALHDWDSVIKRVADELGKLTKVSNLHSALDIKPLDAEEYRMRGVTLAGQGQWDAALAEFRKAAEADPNYADAHIGIGNIFLAQGRQQDALDAYHQALALNPDSAVAHSNLGIVMQALGKTEEALVRYRRALELKPDFADAYNNLGSLDQELGKVSEAIACFGEALRYKPNFVRAKCNLATALLLQGDLAAGLALYENRFEDAAMNQSAATREALAKLSAKPRWLGEDLHGKTLFVWREQGLGDGIMMLRYLPLLKEKGAGKIIVSSHPALARIFQILPGVSQVIGDKAPFPFEDFDCHCALMSLPFLFGTRLETVPNTVPYMTVPPGMAEKWRQRLAATKGLKVGLAWAGSRTQKKDSLRSIALQKLMPLLTIFGVQFISLQKGESVINPEVLDWMDECEDFLDTAALVQQLDLVISVDTAVAHLAGALGKPVWLLNRFESEWRWLLNREDSPWYPTMRIFRQPALHDWDSVINRVAEKLGKLTQASEPGSELEIKSLDAEEYNKRGETLASQGQWDAALSNFRKALEVNPNYADAYTNLGIRLQDQGKYDEALACFRKAMQLKPDIAATHWNLALVLLLRGDMAAGLAHYEKRFNGADNTDTAVAREALAKLASKPRWRGKYLKGKTLLVWNDQALGDGIMMMRYLPLLKDKGAGKILVICQPDLVNIVKTLPAVDAVIVPDSLNGLGFVRIMKTLPAADAVMSRGTSLPLNAFDLHCPLMSLPYLFGTRLDTIPNTVPYITVPPGMTEKWAKRLVAVKGMKVGLVWAGNKTQTKDLLRSIPFLRLAPILAVPSVQFVSLQKGESVVNPQVLDWMDECEDLLDTAALVQQLDLVISVDTAVAHLAGALGKPVWLLNRFESEWRWLLNREDSPWYPTMRIFRQPALHDWDSVIERVTDELGRMVAAASRNS